MTPHTQSAGLLKRWRLRRLCQMHVHAQLAACAAASLIKGRPRWPALHEGLAAQERGCCQGPA